MGDGTDWILEGLGQVVEEGRGLGRGSGNYNGNECGSGMRQKPGCWESFIKYGTAVI